MLDGSLHGDADYSAAPLRKVSQECPPALMRIIKCARNIAITVQQNYRLTRAGDSARNIVVTVTERTNIVNSGEPNQSKVWGMSYSENWPLLNYNTQIS